MRKHLKQLLRQMLVHKYPLKSAKDIEKIQEDMMTGKLMVDHSIWSKMVKQLYAGANAENMMMLLKHKSWSGGSAISAGQVKPRK